MVRLSITLTDEQNEQIEDLVESGAYSSKNDVVQDWITRDEEVNQLEAEVNQLESTIERLEREKQQILAQQQEHGELVRYVQDERTLSMKKHNASAVQRVKWLLFGDDDEEED